MDKALDIINAELTGIFDNIIRAEAASVSNEYKEKLSMTEVHTIAAIGTGTLKSMGEVAKALHITVGTLTVAVSNLVKKGYVQRFKSEKDRRVVRVGLTKQGKEVYHIHEKFHTALTDALVKDLDNDDMEILVKILSNLDSFVAQFHD